MCFLSRWESAGPLKVPWCKILQSIFAVASKNCQKHSYSFISSVLSQNESVQKSSKCCQVMKPAASLHSCVILYRLLYRFTVSCFTFSLYWLSTLGNKICFDFHPVVTERTRAAPRADTSLCHVTSGGSGASLNSIRIGFILHIFVLGY